MKKNTNTYKSILGLSAVAALIGTPAAVMANQVTLTQNSNYSYEDAGEFTASGTGVNPSALGYSSYTSSSSTFQTFCVETEVAFNPGTSYSYSLGSATGNSPQAESDSGGTSSNPQAGINLSEGTAFLYYEFATGGLINEANANEDYNYTYGTSGLSRVNDAGLLQVAIWYFMNKESLPAGYTIPGGYNVQTDPFVVLAESFLGGGSTPADLAAGATDALKANGTGGADYGVAIMQLTSDNGTVANQNQLILTVPDGGMTLAMLGLGLAGLFYVNFQRTKSVARQN